MKRRLLVILIACACVVGCRGAAGPTSTIPQLTTASSSARGGAAAPASNVNELPEDPVVRAVHGVATVTLAADINPATGLPGFLYNGLHGLQPTIEVKPGQKFVINLTDDLPSSAGLAGDINLHFHGLGSSPKKPGDDVLGMLAKPGQSLRYEVTIPVNQQPGLYWYHPHVHAETSFQVGEGGMSGAIVVEGLEKHFPVLAKMKERVIVVRSTGIGVNAAPDDDDAGAPPTTSSGSGMDGMAGMPAGHVHPANSNLHPCVTSDKLTTTLNGAYQPVITIAPGEKQFFRVVNATGHKTLDLNVSNEKLLLLAIDGFALDTWPGTKPEMVTDIIVPPAARAEFIVTGPKNGYARFRSLCYNSGPDGDPDPPRFLAHIDKPLHKTSGGYFGPIWPLKVGAPLPSNVYTAHLPPPAVKRVVIFSENQNPKFPAFFINGQKFNYHGPPMYVVHTGTTELWHIENVTHEIHDFHIHQTHFLVLKINGVKLAHPYWADSIIVPHRYPQGTKSVPGSADIWINFMSPLIKGEFVFHCHILDHEDQGMMAKIEAI